MHPTRREMFRLGLGSSALLACGPTVPQFLARSASALANDRTSPKGRILVVVQLDGGNDGLNTVVPYRDDEYHNDGFDTHSGQLPQHARLLRELGASLKAFLDDLESSGESERVLVLVFSEFGRRLGENGSGGTDHGTAAPVFLLGQPVKAGLHGSYPSLTRLQDGDPIHGVDFRRVYATLLDRWLGIPNRQVLGADFEPMPVLRA